MIFEPVLYIYQSPVGSDYIRDLYEITTELGSQQRDKKNREEFRRPDNSLLCIPMGRS